ncbi:MAG: hypothetical protein AVO33_06515 [delta proteobacterium ML8_F1]|nr:MAG: hypothetical protein AVO33_06515 [delta proteobacterium ML8_F1]
MFFIGVFGISFKEEEKPLASPVEECESPELVRRYRFFHFFFIPLFRWDFEYFLKCSGGRVLKLKLSPGQRAWEDTSQPLSYWDYEIVKAVKTCRVCGAALENTYEYCPQCGTKI